MKFGGKNPRKSRHFMRKAGKFLIWNKSSFFLICQDFLEFFPSNFNKFLEFQIFSEFLKLINQKLSEIYSIFKSFFECLKFFPGLELLGFFPNIFFVFQLPTWKFNFFFIFSIFIKAFSKLEWEKNWGKIKTRKLFDWSKK